MSELVTDNDDKVLGLFDFSFTGVYDDIHRVYAFVPTS